MKRARATFLALLALALTAAGGCSTSPSTAPHGPGVTRVFANVRGVT